MKKYFTTWLFLTLSFFASGTTLDENPPASSTPSVHDLLNTHENPLPSKDEEPWDFYNDFMHMLVVLAVMVTFLILATWILKRIQSTRSQGSNRDSLIKVLETRNLSARSAIHFVEILNKGIIIGESHAGLVRLAEMPLDEDEDTDDEDTIKKI